MGENMKLKSNKPMKWRKILHEDQGVPDNYVHADFLKEMTTNKRVVLYTYKQLVSCSVVLTQQLCVVCIFILSWWFMGDGRIQPFLILAVSLILSCFGYVAYMKDRKIAFVHEKVGGDLRTAVLLLSFTAFFSPVLKTLTHTISTDTIYAMTTFMLLGHFAFHDYDVNTKFSSRSVSLNMAVFASVCLASRLDATFHTFVTVSLAFQLFGLWPILRRSLWKHRPNVLKCMTILMAMFVLIGFFMINFLSPAVFFIVIGSITFFFPAVLVRMQQYKNNIHGPWDEAVIHDE